MLRSPITLEIESTVVERERLSAKQFLKLARENPGLIKSTRLVPPRPGVRGFGSFMVEYTRPVLKAA